MLNSRRFLVKHFHSSTNLLIKRPFLLADIGEGITECEVIQWFVKEGDQIAQFDRICEVQSDKAAVEITSRFDGTVLKIHYKVGDMAKVGSPLVDIDEEDSTSNQPSAQANSSTISKEAQPSPTHALKESAPIQSSKDSSSSILATPAVRRISKELGIDLALVKGTGKDGRILKEDVMNHSKYLDFLMLLDSSASPTPIAAAVKAQIASSTPPSNDQSVPLTKIQKAMFKQMTRSLAIPHFGYADEITMDACVTLRERINQSIARSPPGTYPFSKITYMAIIIKATSLALTHYPILNAAIEGGEDLANVKIKYRSMHNIGVAMDTPNGLLVPNIKNVQSLSILDIAAELHRLVETGKRGALSVADLTGGTMTLSNIGNVGGTYLHPVLVSSEVCIGAIGRMKRVPRYETIVDPATGRSEERVVPRNIVCASWNADHRIIDGATIARFSEKLKSYLEDPLLMTGEMS